MVEDPGLGEFEQKVLLAVLQEGGRAFGLEVRQRIEESTGRAVSRGAFYTTVDRLERKGYVSWEERSPGGRRGGMPQRLFCVTDEGLAALRASREVLMDLWRGLEETLGES